MSSAAIDIEALIPHRGAMRLVEAIDAIEPGRLVAARDIRPDDPVFQTGLGDPGPTVYPPALVVEFVGQAAAALCAREEPAKTGKLLLFAAAYNVTFDSPARACDRLTAEVEIAQRSGSAVFVRGCARVSERVVATVGEAIILYQDAPSLA
jgi:3-hydroxymyristoyl/3-hydroxydecanoyl-(acyl carrier protein) dehydratase